MDIKFKSNYLNTTRKINTPFRQCLERSAQQYEHRVPLGRLNFVFLLSFLFLKPTDPDNIKLKNEIFSMIFLKKSGRKTKKGYGTLRVGTYDSIP